MQHKWQEVWKNSGCKPRQEKKKQKIYTWESGTEKSYKQIDGLSYQRKLTQINLNTEKSLWRKWVDKKYNPDM